MLSGKIFWNLTDDVLASKTGNVLDNLAGKLICLLSCSPMHT